MKRNPSRTRKRAIWIAALVGALACLSIPPLLAERPRCVGEAASIVGRDRGELIVGTNGDDVIVARGGRDYVRGRGGRDLICGGAGADHLDAGGGRGSVSGGNGDDSLVGGSQTEVLDGDDGDDIFFTRGGAGHRISGGAGKDWLSFVDRKCKPGVIVDLTAHLARYRACNGSGIRSWNVYSIENIEGGSRRDSLAGNERRNVVMGHERADVLRGDTNGDRLYGGRGGDDGDGGWGRDDCMEVERRTSCRRRPQM